MMPEIAVSDDVTIYYTEHGRGPTVLLLHGWSCDGSDWSWLVDDLSEDHRVIVLDQRGHGASSPTSGPFGARVLADDAAMVLRSLGIERAVVIGHSMGTIVASALAVEHPDLVSALVLADPVYGQPDDVLEPLVAALRVQPVDVALQLFASFYVANSPGWQRVWHERRLHRTPVNVIRDAFCALYSGPDGIGLASIGERYLRRRACPVLAVYSGTSTAQPDWDRALPHRAEDEIVVWQDSGHFLHQEQPERFAALTRRWLRNLSPTDSPAVYESGIRA
jgi:pimeloyl-ACP methyl ester carboxylesterase